MFMRSKGPAGSPSASQGTSSASASRKTSEDSGQPSGTPKAALEPQGRLSPRSLRSQGSSTSSTMNPHLSFQGDLKYTGSLTVDCEFRGTITSEDTLVVGPAAKVDAELSAGVVEIHGKVRGNVQAKTRVKIYSGGEVCGNIETPTISMEEGVVFEGQCTRPPAATQPSGGPSSVQKVLGGSSLPSKDLEMTT